MNGMDKIIDEAKASVLPYESWERLAGESSPAFAAFCAFRDCGAERNIHRAVESAETDEAVRARRYRVWRNWAAQFHWQERAAGYDRSIEQLKQGELRKTIEAQGEKHRQVTGKMLDMVSKKLDTMNPADLSNNTVTEWVQTAIKIDREMAGLVAGNSKPELKQGELAFVSDFQEL
jgi:hypothetical protein